MAVVKLEESCCSKALLTPEPRDPLLSMPSDLLEHVLSFLPAAALATLGRCCRAFRAKERRLLSGQGQGPPAALGQPAPLHPSLVEKVARDKLMKLHGPELAARWR